MTYVSFDVFISVQICKFSVNLFMRGTANSSTTPGVVAFTLRTADEEGERSDRLNEHQPVA